MIRVPTTQRQASFNPTAGTAQEFRRSDLSGAFGAVGAEILTQSSEFMGNLAKEEDDRIRDEARTDMLTGLAEFSIEGEVRARQIAEAIPGRGIVKATLEDFNERSVDVLEAQPNFLKDEARVRLLPLQVQSAKSAIGLEHKRFLEETSRKEQIYSNSLTNSVRYGRANEETALAQANSYVDSLPASMRDQSRVKLTQGVRQATLQKTLESNPSAAIAAVRAGDFDDLPTNFTQSVHDAGVRTLTAQRNQGNKLLKEAAALRQTDPAKAARKALQAEGNVQPSVQQMLQKQQDLGVPQRNTAVLSKDQSNEMAFQLLGAKSVDEFMSTVNEMAKGLEEQGIPVEMAMRDIERYSDAPPALKSILRTDPAQVDPRYYEAAIQTWQDPKAGKNAAKALALFKDDSSNKSDIVEMEEVISSQVRTAQSVLMKSGVGFVEANKQAQSISDVSFIMANEMASQGIYNSGKLEDALNAAQPYAVVDDGVDGYMMPEELSEAFSQSKLQSVRERVVTDGLINIPTTFPTEALGRDILSEDSGWTLMDNDTLILRYNGQPMTFIETGLPVTISHQALYDLENEGKTSGDDVYTHLFGVGSGIVQ